MKKTHLPLLLSSCLVLSGLLSGACSPTPEAKPTEGTHGSASAQAAPGTAPVAAPVAEWALAIHGGAGVQRAGLPAEMEPAYLKSLQEALELGKSMLEAGSSSLDTVEAVVRKMENDPLFNAGRGAVFTNEGTNELDAAIMDGKTLDCGAISGVTTVKNPITLARRVMDSSRHVFMTGDGAERFADEMQSDRVPPKYFFVQRRYDQWQRAVDKEKAEKAEKAVAADKPSGNADTIGTVGAVALDKNGNLAAATSTGGMTNKRFGRVGDVPVIGAGTYANNRTCAISGTGVGEQFIRNTVAASVSGRMEYGGATLQEAAAAVIHDQLNKDDGGLIAVGHDGSITTPYNTEGMFRGAADSNGRFEVAIWPDGD